MSNVSDKVVDKNKTHFLCLVTFFPQKFRAVYEVIFEKYCTAGRATDENTGHAHCVMDT